MEAPVYISDEIESSLIELVQSSEDIPESDDSSLDTMDLGKRLRNIKPEDFGNYNL